MSCDLGAGTWVPGREWNNTMACSSSCPSRVINPTRTYQKSRMIQPPPPGPIRYREDVTKRNEIRGTSWTKRSFGLGFRSYPSYNKLDPLPDGQDCFIDLVPNGLGLSFRRFPNCNELEPLRHGQKTRRSMSCWLPNYCFGRGDRGPINTQVRTTRSSVHAAPGNWQTAKRSPKTLGKLQLSSYSYDPGNCTTCRNRISSTCRTT
jgi:hypothetical protein